MQDWSLPQCSQLVHDAKPNGASTEDTRAEKSRRHMHWQTTQVLRRLVFFRPVPFAVTKNSKSHFVVCSSLHLCLAWYVLSGFTGLQHKFLYGRGGCSEASLFKIRQVRNPCLVHNEPKKESQMATVSGHLFG